MTIFSLDGDVNKYGSILFDLIAATFIWLFISVFSLGLAMPLATAGFINMVNQTILKKNGYMLSSFFAVFKSNIKRNIGISVFIYILIVAGIFNIWTVLYGYIPYLALFPLYLALFLQINMTAAVTLSMLVESKLSILKLLKFGFILANKHALPASIIALIVAVSDYLIFFKSPAFIMILIAPVHLIIASIVHKKILDKYYIDKIGVE